MPVIILVCGMVAFLTWDYWPHFSIIIYRHVILKCHDICDLETENVESNFFVQIIGENLFIILKLRLSRLKTDSL